MKRNRYAVLAPLALATSVGLLLSGCGTSGDGQASGDTVLKVWDQFTDPSTSAAANKIYAAFEAANPGITIDAESYRFEDLDQLAKTALSSGTGPDVLYYDAGRAEAGLLAESDLILPLTDYADQYGWNDRINPQILKWSTYSDTLYGLGMESEFAGLFADNTLFEQLGLSVPQTLPELLDFCSAASAQGYVPIAYGQGPAVFAKDMYALVANNIVGPQAVSDLIFDNKGSYDSAAMVEAADIWFSQMAKAGCFPDGVNGLNSDNANLLFFSHKALMLAGGSFFIAEIQENMPDDDVSMLPFVSVDGGKGRYFPGGVGSAWIISSQAKVPDAAAKFLDFLFSDDSVKTWMEDGAIVPPVETDLSALTLSPLARTAAQLIQQGTDDAGDMLGYYIWPVWSGELFNQFQDGAQAITAGQKSAAEFAAEVQKQWDEDQADD